MPMNASTHTPVHRSRTNRLFGGRRGQRVADHFYWPVRRRHFLERVIVVDVTFGEDGNFWTFDEISLPDT